MTFPAVPPLIRDSVKAFAVIQAVHVDRQRFVGSQPGEDRRRGVDGVAAHPGPGGVGGLPRRCRFEPAGAVAPAFDGAISGFEQDGEVAAQQVAVVADQPAQATLHGLHFLVVIERQR
jgi:hypothetical protein